MWNDIPWWLYLIAGGGIIFMPLLAFNFIRPGRIHWYDPNPKPGNRSDYLVDYHPNWWDRH